MTDVTSQSPSNSFSELPGLKEKPALSSLQASTVANDKSSLAADHTATVGCTKTWEFLIREQTYLSDYIRFADQKASFLFTFSLAVIGYLFRQGSYKAVFAIGLKLWIVSNLLSSLSIVLLSVACLASLNVLLPRLITSVRQSLIFWQGVKAYKTADAYWAAVKTASDQSLQRALADHCFTLSLIATKKYFWIKVSLWAGPIGALFGIFSLVSV